MAKKHLRENENVQTGNKHTLNLKIGCTRGELLEFNNVDN